MNSLQLDKCTVLKYSPLQSIVTLKPGYRSLKVIKNDIIRQVIYDFLLIFSSNYGSIVHRF